MIEADDEAQLVRALTTGGTAQGTWYARFRHAPCGHVASPKVIRTKRKDGIVVYRIDCAVCGCYVAFMPKALATPFRTTAAERLAMEMSHRNAKACALAGCTHA